MEGCSECGIEPPSFINHGVSYIFTVVSFGSDAA